MKNAAIRWIAMGFLMLSAGMAYAGDIEDDYKSVEKVAKVKQLFSGVPESAVGEAIQYPGGTPAEISAAVVTLQPGKTTAWHKHGVPLFIYVQSGSLTVDYGDKGTRTVPAGSAFMEAMDHRHRGINAGTVPVQVLVVYMGGDGLTNVIKE